jgi:hypothetical protein
VSRIVSAIDAVRHLNDAAEWRPHGLIDITCVGKAYASLSSDTPRAYLEIDGMAHTPNTATESVLVLRDATAFCRHYLQHATSAGAILASAAPANVTLESARFP